MQYTGQQALIFKAPVDYRTGLVVPPTAANVARYGAQFRIMCGTAGNDEAWSLALAELPDPPRNLQYILGFEVEINSLSPYHNGWSFGIARCVQNIAFKPDAWWHTGMTPVTVGAGVGGTGLTVADGSKLQDITAPGVGMLDVFTSAGNYKGMITYSALAGNAISQIPESGYGAIGYNPGTISTISTLTAGTYSPGVQCPAGVAVGDLIWGRATSNPTALHGGGNFPEPRSATYATWAAQSYAYYRSTVAANFGDILLDNMDTADSRWPTVANPVRPGGTTSGGVFTPTDWTTAQPAISTVEYTNSYAHCLQAYAAISPTGKLWGNTAAAPWSSPASYLTVVQSYRAAGLTGLLLEAGGGMAGEYSSPGWFTPAKVAGAISIYQAWNGLGGEIIGMTQMQGTDYAAELMARDDSAYAWHCILWDPKNFYCQPANSGITNSYQFVDTPRTAPYLQLLGRPSGPFAHTVVSGGEQWRRVFEYRTVTIFVPSAAGPHTVTWSPT